MKDDNDRQLKYELLQAGANGTEIFKLSNLASQLHTLKDFSPPLAANPPHRRTKFQLFKPYFVGAAVLALAILPILLAQTVLPGNWLFPVQKATDAAVIELHPQYRANVMMKRSEQVNALVKNGSDSQVILATLNDYTNQAKRYEAMPNTDYAAFEYCKTNLEQAAAKATPTIQRSIQASLDELDT